MNTPKDSSNGSAERDEGLLAKGSRVLRFSELACGKNELFIEHQGQTYLLRVTKNGKLLLNK